MKKLTLMLNTLAAMSLTSCLKASDSQSEYNYVKEYMDKIVACLDNGDTDGLRKLFSSYVQNSSETLDSKIQEILEYYEGTFKEYKRISGIASGEKVQEGQLIEQHIGNVQYELVTDRKTYFLSFAAVTVDAESPQLVGLHRIWFGTDKNSSGNFVIVE